MHVEASGGEAISALRKISSELEEIFDEIHSMKNLFRSPFRGRDFEGQMRRAEDLESRVCTLRTALFNHVGPISSIRLRPPKVYWCCIFLAASSLAEITARDHNEVSSGARSTHSYRQESIERYRVAMQGAKKEWKRLVRNEAEGGCSRTSS